MSLLSIFRRKPAPAPEPFEAVSGLDDFFGPFDANGFHRCNSRGMGPDPADLSCGRGPLSGRYCRPPKNDDLDHYGWTG